MPIKKKVFDMNDDTLFNKEEPIHLSNSYEPMEDSTASEMEDAKSIENVLGEKVDTESIFNQDFDEDFDEYINKGDKPTNPELSALKMMVSNYYQNQKARVAHDNRIFAAFIQSIGIKPGTLVYVNPAFRQLMQYMDKDDEDVIKVAQALDKFDKDPNKSKKKDVAEENAKAYKVIIKYLRRDYGLITKAVAALVYNKQTVDFYNENGILFTMVQELSVSKLERALYKIFKNNREHCDYRFIQNVYMYHMVQTSIKTHNVEKQINDQIKSIVQKFPIWNQYGRFVKGLGELTMACLLAKIDIRKCSKFGNLLAYAGYDTVLNPETGLREGRCNGFWKGKAHHQVTRYRPLKGGAKGEMEPYQSISYSPFIKTKCFLLAGTIFKCKNDLYTSVYWDYRNRLEERNKTMDQPRTKGHINMMAIRYMIKFVLQDLWYHWRLVEGLPVTIPYPDAYLNHGSHIRTINLEQSVLTKTKPTVVMELVDWDKLDNPKYLSGKLLDELREQEHKAA